MRLGLRVEMRPTRKQLRAFVRHAGTRRYAYNWGLRRKKEASKKREIALLAGIPPSKAPKVPTAVDLHRELNQLKKRPVEQGGVPWMYEVSKAAPQEALRDLDKAFSHFFRRVKAGEKPGYPRFESRKRGLGGFAFDATIRIEHERIELPRIGWVRLMPGERGRIPLGTYSGCRVTERAGHWFVSVLGPEVDEAPVSGPEVGIDLGVRALATCSDGTVLEAPRPLKVAERKLKKAQQSLARKKPARPRAEGEDDETDRSFRGKNREKARRKLARRYKRTADLRSDFLHKATTSITKTYGRVVLEDLRVSNLTRRRRGRGRAAKAGLNRAILDCGLYEFRRQLEYKGIRYGCRVELVNPAYTSQTCSRCGQRNDPGTREHYVCDGCGLRMDRDLNAAHNLLAAASCTEAGNACGADVRRDLVSQSAVKQEPRG